MRPKTRYSENDGWQEPSEEEMGAYESTMEDKFEEERFEATELLEAIQTFIKNHEKQTPNPHKRA